MRLKKHKDLIGLAAGIVFIYGVMHLVGIGCPIKFVTGISCLGCGMTRAWLSVLKLDFSAAFYYHPLFMLPPVAVIVYFIKSKINLKIYKIIMLTIVAAFITIYLYRLIFTDGDIVVFEPGNNIIFRLLEYERK
ncbi:MAG: DUF2752 domain-containing protein [Butyrivibrio sp.]|nr:DUF2752 domain-containing protein [Acetatifactor muris]MCM1558348.1 DUF2752 domain-containing protein [Butyrivibrio sp.]